jgi:hypothetical protein
VGKKTGPLILFSNDANDAELHLCCAGQPPDSRRQPGFVLLVWAHSANVHVTPASGLAQLAECLVVLV